MFNGWKITNILDVGLCELDTADGPYNKTGYRLVVCPNKPTMVRGDHLLAYLKGKTSLHQTGPGSLTAKASRPRPPERKQLPIGAKS